MLSWQTCDGALFLQSVMEPIILLQSIQDGAFSSANNVDADALAALLIPDAGITNISDATSGITPHCSASISLIVASNRATQCSACDNAMS